MVTVQKLATGKSRVCLNSNIHVSYNDAKIQGGHNLTQWPTRHSNKTAQISKYHLVVAEPPLDVTSQRDSNKPVDRSSSLYAPCKCSMANNLMISLANTDCLGAENCADMKISQHKGQIKNKVIELCSSVLELGGHPASQLG